MANEIERIRRRTTLLGSIVGLLIAMLRVPKVQLDYERPPGGESKRILVRAIERTKKTCSRRLGFVSFTRIEALSTIYLSEFPLVQVCRNVVG